MSEQDHLRNVLSSSTFHASESLQRLLNYLAENSLGDPPHPVKEYQIAAEVLGRGREFDPRVDSSVRVNVARLRTKLLEYYATEGKDDALRIEIPKGSYVTLFRERREAVPEKPALAEISTEAADTRPPDSQSTPKRLRSGALATALAAGFVLGALITLWMNPGQRRDGRSNAALQAFWSGFTGPLDKTIVVFSNARFVGTAESGLRYFDPTVHQLEEVRDLHTGVGEVVGVYELSLLFQGLGAGLEVKRAALVDWDEVKKANVIFIGGPAENMPVRELRGGAQFVFEPHIDSNGGQRMVVANRRSRDGQPQRFDPGIARPLRRDYAVIRLVPGLIPGRRILILAGITTLGTQAAVEFVCRPDTVQALLSKLAEQGSEGTLGFECVLEVSINGGVPVDSSIVAFHKISGGPGALSSAE